MAIPIRTIRRVYSDPETGCHGSDQAAFESCRQTYFLKQQNQILKYQQTKQVESSQTTIPVVASSAPSQVETRRSENGTTFLLILVIVILVSALITKHLSNK